MSDQEPSEKSLERARELADTPVAATTTASKQSCERARELLHELFDEGLCCPAFQYEEALEVIAEALDEQHWRTAEACRIEASYEGGKLLGDYEHGIESEARRAEQGIRRIRDGEPA